MKHRRKHSRRRFHRNPSFARKGGGGGGMGGTFKTAALGAAGILVNNLLSNQLGSFLGTTTIAGLGSPKTIVKVALPLVAGATFGRRNQAVKAASAVALAAALVEILKPLLPTSLGLAGSGDYLPTGVDIYRDGFRPVASMSGYTDSMVLPSSIAN